MKVNFDLVEKMGGGGFNPKTGPYMLTNVEQGVAMLGEAISSLCLLAELTPLDTDNNPVRGAETVQLKLPYAKNELGISFNPGYIDNPDGEPKDLGSKLGTKGNTIFIIKPVSFKPSPAIQFMITLAAAGFPSEYRGYTPHMNGLKLNLASIDPVTANKRWPSLQAMTRPRSKDKDGKPFLDKEGKEVTHPANDVFAVDKWLNPNDKIGETSGGSSQGTPATATGPDDLVRQVLHSVADRKAGTSVKNVTTLKTFATQDFAKLGIEGSYLSGIHAVILDESRLKPFLSEIGAEMANDGSIAFVDKATLAELLAA